MAASANVEFRSFRPGDELAINEGFNEVFGLSRSLDEWRWKFPEQPEGRFIMLALDPTGRVLAHYGAVAMAVQFGDQRVRAGQIVDAFSRTEVRGSRVFSSCYEDFIELFGNSRGLSLMYGFPGRRHYEMGFKALKYVPIASVPFWSRPIGRHLSLPRWRHRCTKGFDSTALDALWSRASARYGVAIVRDAAWLGRRFRNRPGLPYTHLLVWRGGRARAWAVVRAEDGVLRWADFLWDGEDRSDLAVLDEALDRAARQASCTTLELWLGGDPAAAAVLEDRGWKRAACPQDLLLVARTFDPIVELNVMRERLYLTMGDSDLV